MMRRRDLLALSPLSLAAAPRCDLLVQGALDVELGPLLDSLSGRRERRLENWHFWEGALGRQQAVVSRTDVGPINAVAATTLGVRHYRPRRVINQGTAGAQNRALNVHDIVLGEKTVDYSVVRTRFAPDGAGIDPPARWTPRPHRLRMNGELRDYGSFPGDPALLALAGKRTNPRGKVVRGVIGSAFQFHLELDFLAWCHRTFGTDSEDMESAYCHGLCVALGIPFLAIRMISDAAWKSPEFDKQTGVYCAEFVSEMVQSWPKA